MRAKLVLFVVAALWVSQYMTVPAGAAGTTKIPVSAITVWGSTVVPGVEKYPSGAGLPGQADGNPYDWVMQMRGQVSTEQWEGDSYLQGTVLASLNYSAHIQCSEYWTCEAVGGALQVAWSMELDAFDGGWQGTAALHIVSTSPAGFVYEGTSVAAGYGELEGWRLQLSIWTDAQHNKYQAGYVFAPGVG